MLASITQQLSEMWPAKVTTAVLPVLFPFGPVGRQSIRGGRGLLLRTVEAVCSTEADTVVDTPDDCTARPTPTTCE